MSKDRALVRFHDWRTAPDRKAVTRRLWRSRCIGLVAVPVSIGLATLMVAVGTSSFCTRRLTVAQIRGDHRWRREQQRLKLRLFSLFGLLLCCPFHAADGIDWFWRLRRRRLQCRRALPHVFEMPLARHRLDEEVAHRPDQRIDPVW